MTKKAATTTITTTTIVTIENGNSSKQQNDNIKHKNSQIAQDCLIHWLWHSSKNHQEEFSDDTKKSVRNAFHLYI